MEPTIYKPSIYNGTGVYNGDGIYNGRGVYNDGGAPSGQFVKIGSFYYPYININGVLWITENIKEDTEFSVWYNNDQNFAESRRYGKLYRGASLSITLEPLENDGWHITTPQDWQDMVDFLGYPSNQILDKICSVDYWAGENYHNLTGLDMVPAGIADSPNNFRLSGMGFAFYCRGGGWYVYSNTGDGSTRGDPINGSYYMSIRFCKTL